MADPKEQEEEQAMSFLIPTNFTDSGKLFNGMIDTRNAIEAVVLVGGLGKLEQLILFDMLGFKIAIIVMIVTLSPILIGTVIGINGDCFTIFMKTFFTFLKNKRKLRFRRIYVNGEENLHRATKGSGAKSKKTTSKSKARKK